MLYLVFAMLGAAFLYYAAGRSAPPFFRSLPAFLSGVPAGVLAAFLQALLLRISGGTASSVAAKALSGVFFDALLPLLLLCGVNFLFFRAEMESSESGGFAGWFLPQFFACLAVYEPFSLFVRFQPLDAFFCFFHTLFAVLAVFLCRAAFFRSGPDCSFPVFPAVLAPPFAALAWSSVLSAFWFFGLPPRVFLPAASVSAAVLLAAVFLLGRKKEKTAPGVSGTPG